MFTNVETYNFADCRHIKSCLAIINVYVLALNANE